MPNPLLFMPVGFWLFEILEWDVFCSLFVVVISKITVAKEKAGPNETIRK